MHARVATRVVTEKLADVGEVKRLGLEEADIHALRCQHTACRTPYQVVLDQT